MRRAPQIARGYGNQPVGSIDPASTGYCHPQQAKRTKCVCGKTVRLHFASTLCTQCGRRHIKAPGAAFARTGLQPVRPGGRCGCPGTP